MELDYTGITNKNMAAAQTLFETIASVLSKSARSTLNVESNFYELGGNSLNSIYTVTKLRDQGYVIGKPFVPRCKVEPRFFVSMRGELQYKACEKSIAYGVIMNIISYKKYWNIYTILILLLTKQCH